MDERIQRVMAAVLGVAEESLNENTSAYSIANWDSLRHMNLIVALEEEFGVRFGDDDIPVMTNFKLLRHMIQQELEK